MEQKLFVIILNYNGWQDTLECVQSVENCEYEDLVTVVVDNASTDGSYEILLDRLSPNVVLLRSETNIGYAGGNNIGIRYAQENGADFICVLNNDTVVEAAAFSKCVAFLKKEPKAGFVGPVIMEYRGDVVQSTGGDIYIQKGEVTLNNNGRLPSELPERIPCDYIGGACILFRTSLLDTVGLIPECYFLFFEETEWCCRAKRAGYENICISGAYVRHKGSASIDAVDGLHSYLMEHNRVVFVRRNIGNTARYVLYLLYQITKTIYRAAFKDRINWRYLRYQMDGALNKVDTKRFPFIVIKDAPQTGE